jgi:hypothetical protein
MVAATASEKRHTSGQPRPKAAPPTLESPWWKEVTPPARMQMIESGERVVGERPHPPPQLLLVAEAGQAALVRGDDVLVPGWRIAP